MRTAAHIIETVGKLVKKYDTRDPYELCKCLEIKIHFYNLEKKLKGFFFYQSRQKNIVIDSNENDVLERILLLTIGTRSASYKNCDDERLSGNGSIRWQLGRGG